MGKSLFDMNLESGIHNIIFKTDFWTSILVNTVQVLEHLYAGLSVVLLAGSHS